VPINAESGGGVISLTFVFAVAAIVLFGWAAGACCLLRATSIIQLLGAPPARAHLVQRRGARRRGARRRRRSSRRSAATASARSSRAWDRRYADYWVNMLLISAAIALSTDSATRT
jgi:hypothetical protein